MADEGRTRSDGGLKTDYPPPPEPLPVGVFDSHTHLDLMDGLAPLDPATHLARAAAAGIVGIVQVGVDVAASRWGATLAARDERVLAAVAVHPNEAPLLAARGELDDALVAIDALAGEPRVRAVGETGLDFFRTGDEGRPAQFAAFEGHIAIAKRHGIAVQIHDRDAHDAVVATLRRVGAPKRVLFHCFSGDTGLARIAADEGWYCSFAGNLTFASAGGLREALCALPLDRILVETDAPFLTPVPHRGRPNAPYLVPYTVRCMAQLRGVSVEEMCLALAANTVAVFGSWT